MAHKTFSFPSEGFMTHGYHYQSFTINFKWPIETSSSETFHHWSRWHDCQSGWGTWLKGRAKFWSNIPSLSHSLPFLIFPDVIAQMLANVEFHHLSLLFHKTAQESFKSHCETINSSWPSNHQKDAFLLWHQTTELQCKNRQTNG